MGWSGRAPAPPASEAGKGRQRRGARHVSDSQYRNRRDRHRYRQELVPRRGPRCARHRAASEVVAWPSGSAACQYTALPDRHDPILWGTLVFVNLQAAFLSPPVAMSAFYLKGVSPKHVTLNQIFAGMMPYMLIVILCMVIMYLWPGMTLWLPNYLYGA